MDYAVTEMGYFDDYLDAAPHAKTIRRNGITNFLLHISQCIIFNQNKFVTSTLISEAWLNSLYSRLFFKVIKDFATSHNFEEACEKFHDKSVKSKKLQKQKIGLQCYLTIPQRVTILHDS